MKLVIPENQYVEKGEKFTIIVNDEPISLIAEETTYSASYDTHCYTTDFNPYHHGFKGMNVPICRFITKILNTDNTMCREYLEKQKAESEVVEGISLDKCQAISNEDYLLLNEPLFVGQTRVDNTGHYYMVWLSDGEYYKTYNKL